MRIEYLCRFPVKGLTAEALEAAEVEPGGAIPWDRAFALAQGDRAVRPGAPGMAAEDRIHVPDANARIALLRSMFDPRTGDADDPGAGGSEVIASTR